MYIFDYKLNAMNIEAEKIELVKMLLETDNPKIIESIKKIFKKQKSVDFWDDLSVIPILF
jgi:hypothetical protein